MTKRIKPPTDKEYDYVAANYDRLADMAPEDADRVISRAMEAGRKKASSTPFVHPALKYLPFTPSDNQIRIFQAIALGDFSFFVKAVAGAGKSTTILWGLLFVRDDVRNISLIAFNKKIVEDLKRKIEEIIKLLEDASGLVVASSGLAEIRAMISNLRRARISTFHSAGLGAYRYAKKNCRIDGDKMGALLNTHPNDGGFTEEQVKLYGFLATRLVGLAKNNGIGVLIDNTPAAWEAIVEHHGFDLDTDEGTMGDCIEVARRLLRMSIDAATRPVDPVIDFDDMLYMPIMAGSSFFPQDLVLVDELQDSNGIQLEMIHRMLRRGSGRVGGVGDPCQAIYGFRGSDATAVDNFVRRFHAVELPLTVSYRCARAIVASVQHLVPYIEAAPNAVEGTVETVLRKDLKFAPEDVILCRINAPLVQEAMRQISNKVPCRMLGRDIGQGLVRLIKKMRAPDVETLLQSLDLWERKERERWLKKGKDSQADAVSDRADCIRAFVGEDLEQPISALIREVEDLFTDDPNARVLTLASVHKFKGSERQRVFILRPEMMQLKARREWAAEQERNVEYVARTRAMVYLGLIQD